MKNYFTPELEITLFDESDVITTSVQYSDYSSVSDTPVIDVNDNSDSGSSGVASN